MYICNLCKKNSKPGEPSVPLVVETREKQYPFRPNVNRVKVRNKDGTAKVELRDDPGGVGIETVREIRAHARCVVFRAASAWSTASL